MTLLQYDFDAIFGELEAAGLGPKILRRPRSTTLVVSGVVADSRKTGLSTVFCAIKGENHDGHLTITQNSPRLSMVVIEASTAAVPLDNLTGEFGAISVSSTRKAWAQLASFFAGHPSRHLKMIAVTGTNGKTSCAWMVKSLLDTLEIPCASIGTLGFHLGTSIATSSHTTPDPDALYPALQAYIAQGLKCVVMEVSSHSLVQGKIWPIAFDGAAFTSFSQDHLDFHADMDDYLAAKMQLFYRQLSSTGFALVHESVAQWPQVQTFLNSNTHPQSLKQIYGRFGCKADFEVVANSFYAQGRSHVRVVNAATKDRASAEIPMVGDVFSDNFAAALILVSKTFSLSLADLSKEVSKPSALKIPPVPGRLELVLDPVKPWRPLVYVDYAHTPDALQKAIVNLSAKPKSVTTVFGCGGERDKLKRPVMGELAARFSKSVIVTSDNPRTEDPMAIVHDVMRGAGRFTNVQAVVDRKDALACALRGRSARDVILIAGKGHENYQILGTTKTHFSDREEALKILSSPRGWLVYGAGISGFAAASRLEALGEIVYLSDDRTITPPPRFSSRIHLVGLVDVPWSDVCTVVISPGIPLTHAVVSTARSLNKDVITEIDLGFNRYKGSILAVTGTNGKSTTVMMTEFLCRELGMDAHACGNIGLPPVALNLSEATAQHLAVVELSSYQLEGSSRCLARCAAITSFSFDHLARHLTMAAYFAAKWRVVEWLNDDSLLVVSLDVFNAARDFAHDWPTCRSVVIGPSPAPRTLPENCTYLALDLGKCEVQGKLLDFESLGIMGNHNQVNSLMAVYMALHMAVYKAADVGAARRGDGPPTGPNVAELLKLVAGFRPLPYRCEVVFDDGVRKIVNDSKSTNLESTVAAVTVSTRPLILLMGGQGKGESYLSLSSKSASIRCLVTFGASREEIARDTRDKINTVVFEKMQDAVLHALRVASDNSWDVVFSPGCASFDEFNNFEHRGAVFSEIVAAFNVQT